MDHTGPGSSFLQFLSVQPALLQQVSPPPDEDVPLPQNAVNILLLLILQNPEVLLLPVHLQTISFDKWSGCPCEQPYVTEVRQLDFLSKTGSERIPSRMCLLFQSQK